MKLANHVNDTELRTLLYADEESSTDIAQHVEACELCQQRLSHMAAMNVTDSEVSALLSGFVEVVGADSCSVSEGARGAQKNLGSEFQFAPPSHPEMLGRLGRYEIERVIGSGGMGVVFKAIDTELNRPVAIKVLAPHLARNGAARQRFGRESRAAAAVVHEHVVAIHNVESDRETPFIVMQFVSGESLQARVTRLGPLSPQQILRIGIQAASGLAAAHEQGIVHRDVKPANILLEDGVERILLTDFGLAQTVDDASLTHTGFVAGTPHYMSPEQANGDAVDYRSDLFSLGAVLYFVATGHPPFRAERAMGVLNRICHERHRPAWQINGDLPTDLSEAIDRLLEKRPAKRFASALAVRDVLTRILQQLQNRKPSMSAALWSWARRHAARKLILPACIAVLAAVAMASWWGVGNNILNGLLTSVSAPPRMPPPKLDQASSGIPSSGIPSSAVTSMPENSMGRPLSDSTFIDAEFDGQDRSAFTQEIRELQRSLDSSDRDQSLPSRTEVDWRIELRDLSRRLDRLDQAN